MRFLCSLLCLFTVATPAAEIVLDTRHVIHLAADAPQTARQAALELQQVIQQATGMTLQITSDPALAPAVRIVSDKTLPHDGFEIRQEGADIIIAGNDDLAPAKPDAWFVPSHGTFFGALEFLERFVGARWLLPGDLGLDVPRVESIRVLLPQPLRGAPAFATRSLAYVGESDPRNSHLPPTAPSDWLRHQRLTNAFHPFATGYGHSWDDYLRPGDFLAHPEWKPSSGSYERKGKVTFFCTTAPGLVDLFAKRVMESIDRNPTREMTSISPTDGGGFCTCERCAKLISKDPHGKPNHARAILSFYTEVARIIERELQEPAVIQPGDEGPVTLSTLVERHLTSYFADQPDGVPAAGLYDRVLEEVERPLIQLTLAATRGNQVRAAEILGLNRNTLRKKIQDLGVEMARGRR